MEAGPLTFEKMHGNGNDFVVFFCDPPVFDTFVATIQPHAVRLCNRRTGIGADGVVVATSLAIINRGNALRCVAVGLHERAGQIPLAVVVDTGFRDIPCAVSGAGIAAVDMGVPTQDTAIGAWPASAQARVAGIASAHNLSVDKVSCVNTGNNHVVVVFPAGRPCESVFHALGSGLQTEIDGLDGVNVHLISPRAATHAEREALLCASDGDGDGSVVWDTVTWERGAGPTLACGTGACAVATVVRERQPAQEWTGVAMPGGLLVVRHTAATQHVHLVGSATTVFRGKIAL